MRQARIVARFNEKQPGSILGANVDTNAFLAISITGAALGGLAACLQQHLFLIDSMSNCIPLASAKTRDNCLDRFKHNQRIQPK